MPSMAQQIFLDAPKIAGKSAQVIRGYVAMLPKEQEISEKLIEETKVLGEVTQSKVDLGPIQNELESIMRARKIAEDRAE